MIVKLWCKSHGDFMDKLDPSKEEIADALRAHTATGCKALQGMNVKDVTDG